MRRKFIDSWEVEARDRAETLRIALAGLLELRQKLKMGEVDPKEFFERIDASLAEATSEREWAPDWATRATGRIAPQALPAFAVFADCLMRLAGATELFARSLAVLFMSPDPEGVITPGEPDVRLAASGIDVAQDVATMALGMIHDTPAIRRKHEKMVQTTLQGLTETSKPMVALITPVSARFSELADEYRRKGYDITGGRN